MNEPNITAVLKSGGKLYTRAEDWNQDLYFWSPFPEKITEGQLFEMVRTPSGLIQVSLITRFEIDKVFRFHEDQFLIPKSGEDLFLDQASRCASIFGTLQEVDRFFIELGAHEARKHRNGIVTAIKQYLPQGLTAEIKRVEAELERRGINKQI